MSLNFMGTVTMCTDFGAQEKRIGHCFYFSPSICHEVMGQDAMILVFWMLNFKPAFSLSSFTFIKRLFSSSSLSAIRVVSSAYVKVKVNLLSRVQLLAIPWSAAYQAPPSMGFSRQQYRSGVPLHMRGYWYFSRQSWFQLELLPAQRFSWCTLHRS